MTRNGSDLGLLSRGPAQGLPPVALAWNGAARGQAVPRPQPRWKSRVLLPAALLLTTAALIAYAARDALRPAKGVRVVPVVVRAVQDTGAGGGSATVQAPGWVEPDPYPLAVPALSDGVVKEVLILEGQPVEAGQVVVRLIDDDAKLMLARAEADVHMREGALGVARAAAEAAKQDWENPVERKRSVETAEAMLAEAQAEFDRLPVEVEAEQARADELRDAARRAEANVARQAVGESELVQTRLRLKAQEATLAATKAKGPVLAAKVRQREADLAAAREAARLRIAERKMLDEARAGVREAEGALLESRAVCREAELRLSRMEVKSPVAGIVMTRMAEPGAKMMQGGEDPRSAQVARLYDPKKLQVRVDVPLADASHVGVGHTAKVIVGVLPDRTFDGVVTRVVHEADIQRNTVQFKVAIKDPSPELKPEMLTRVRFYAPARKAGDGAATEAQAHQVFAPGGLLRREGQAAEAKVWAVDKGHGTASLRTVSLGESRHGDWVAVVAGLNPGDVLIAGDTSSLSEGDRVKILGEDETAAAGGSDVKEGSHGAH
jgi:HlyD family secretion protein